MFIKKTQNKKKNLSKFNKFFKIYFFSTMFFAICLLIVIFKSQTFIQQKKIFLDKFSKGGRYEYLYLPRILFKALKHNFYPIEKMDVRIKFENIIILETTRKKAAEVGALKT